MGRWSLLLVMCPVLVLLACSEQAEAEADLCDGVECSGHGRCVAVDVEALCQCDDGYLTAGLNCVEPVPVPEIISFGPDEPKVTQDEHAIFTLVVSGPKGEPDPVDAQLETDDGAVIAQFGLSDQARVYKAAVSWAELDALEDITFIGSEARSFAVRMTDAEGTESTSSAELTLWCKGFGACRGLCNPAMMIHESLDLEPVETCEGWQCSSGADYPTDCLTNPTAYLWMSDAQLDKLMSDVKADIEADGFFYFMDQCMEVGVELHGGLARKFDKKAFKVKFNRETWFPLDPFVESDSEVHAAPIGFKQFILKAHWVDPSLLRDKLTHEYVRLVGGLSPRVTHVNLVLNGKYHGVYALTENILEDFFLRMELKADGNLYKAVSHQANLKQKADVMSGYEKKMNKSGSSEDLADLLDTIAKAPLDPDQFQDMVGEVIDLDLYFAYALVNVFATTRTGVPRIITSIETSVPRICRL